MRRFVALAPLLLAACGDSGTAPVVGEFASDRIELTVDVAEPILAIDVVEGQSVAKGEVLFRQDDRRAAARLAEVDAQVAELEARLRELKRGPRAERIDQARALLDAAREDAAFRRADLERIEGVAALGLTSADALDRAKAANDTAASMLALRRSELEEALAGTTVEELDQAEQRLAQARARRDAAALDLERLTATAPVTGIIDSRLFEVGERPLPGQAVLTLLTGSQAHARVYVPEALRTRIVPGVSVSLSADGIDEPIPGRVRWVSSDAEFTPYFALTERDRGHLSFQAKIDIADDRDRLPDGLPVTVTLPGTDSGE